MITEGNFLVELWLHENANAGNIDSISYANFSGQIPAAAIEKMYEMASVGLAAFDDYPDTLARETWLTLKVDWSVENGAVTLCLSLPDYQEAQS